MWKDGSWLVCCSLAGFFLPQEPHAAASIPCGWSLGGPCAFTLGYRCNGRVSGHIARLGWRSVAQTAQRWSCLSGCPLLGTGISPREELWRPLQARHDPGVCPAQGRGGGDSAEGRDCSVRLNPSGPASLSALRAKPFKCTEVSLNPCKLGS